MESIKQEVQTSSDADEDSLRFQCGSVAEKELRQAFESLLLDVSLEELKELRTKMLCCYSVYGEVTSSKSGLSLSYDKWDSSQLLERARNMVYNQSCILKANTSLVIPKFRLYILETETALDYDGLFSEHSSKVSMVLLREIIPVNRNEKVQKKLYSTSKNAVEEFAVLICKTGYPDVNYRESPILKDGRLCLLGHNKPRNPTLGLAGEYHFSNDGLINLTSPEIAVRVAEISRKYNLEGFLSEVGWSSELVSVESALRRKHPYRTSGLADFHQRNGIRTGRELLSMKGIEYPELRGLPIDEARSVQDYPKTVEEFALDLKEYQDRYTCQDDMNFEVKHYKKTKEHAAKRDLRFKARFSDMEAVLLELTRQMIKAINECISNPKEEVLLADRRRISFKPMLTGFAREYFDSRKMKPLEDGDITYGEYVIQKLIQEGKIYNVWGNNGHGYNIQA